MFWTIVGLGALVAMALGRRRRTLLWLGVRQRLRRKRPRHVEAGGVEEEEEEAP